MTSSPRCACESTPQRFPIIPLGTYTAAALPTASAERSSSRFTVGSSPYWSSPTSASAMALRMAGVGFVNVSLRNSRALTVLPSIRGRRRERRA